MYLLLVNCQYQVIKFKQSTNFVLFITLQIKLIILLRNKRKLIQLFN